MPRVCAVDSVCGHLQQRFVTCALCCGVMTMAFVNRQTYFQAINKMVFKSGTDKHSVSKCPYMISTDLLESQAEFYWDPGLVRAIHQAFYIGCLITNIPVGVLADFYGSKGIVGVGLVAMAVVALLCPALASCGAFYLMFGRFSQGLAQGLVMPCMAVIIAHWFPHRERTTAASIVMAGQLMGWCLPHVLSNHLIEQWRITFYLTGAIGLLYFCLWHFFGFSKPAVSPHIAQPELALIHSNLEGINRRTKPFRPYVPWAAILSSPPVISLLLINWGSLWIHYLMLNSISFYFIHVLRMTPEISHDAEILATMAIIPSAIFWGAASDWLINHNYMTRTTNRKAMAFIFNILTIPLLMAIPLAGCNRGAALVLYLLVCFCRGPVYPIIRVNAVDLSPHHAGTLLALMFSTGMTSALFAWELFSKICDEPSDINKWSKLFLISSLILLLLSLPYLRFGSAEVQPWNWSLGVSRSFVRHISTGRPLEPSAATSSNKSF